MAKKNKKIYEMLDQEILERLYGISSLDKFDIKSTKSVSDLYETMNLAKKFMSMDSTPYLLSCHDSENGGLPEEIQFDFSADIFDETSEGVLFLSDSVSEIKASSENRKKAAESAQKTLDNIFDDIQKKSRHQYTGPYKAFNERLKRLYKQFPAPHDKALRNPIPGYQYNHRKNTINQIQELKFSLQDEDIDVFWEMAEALATVEMWGQYQQIYEIKEYLALDFANQDDVTLPEDALNRIPFSVFYIDLTNIPKYELQPDIFTGALIRIEKIKDGHKIIIFLEENRATKDSIEYESKKDYIQKLHDCREKVLTRTDIVIPKNVSFTLTKYETYQSHRQTFQEAYETIEDDVAKNGCEDAFKAFDTTYKVIFWLIFYLCCNRKPQKPVSNYINKPAVTNPNAPKTEPTITVLGTKTLRLSQEDYDEAKRINQSGASGRKIGHAFVVAGHKHHYWIGKKNSPERQKIYKYLEPYWKGLEKFDKVPQKTIVKN